MDNLINYCTEDLAKGSVLSMEKGTPLVKMMPYKKVRGNAYSYNIINTLIPTEHREVGTDVANAHELEPIKKTVTLKVLTNRAQVDRAMSIMSDVTDLMAEQQAIGMLSLGKALEKHCLGELQTYAKGGTVGKEFKGVLSVDLLDDAIDFVQQGANAIFVNNNTHRALKKLLKEEGYAETMESMGKRVMAYNNIPVFVSHDLADNTVIIARIGEDAVHGITNKGLVTYNTEKGVMQVTDTELIHNIVVKTTNSFAVIKVGNSPATAKN